jgi:hypothetical protein
MTHDPREALEPCPFCNGEAEIHRRGDHRVSTIYRCTNCGCRLETGEEFSHGKRWNERAITASAPKAEPAADWSNLPKDIYVTGAERVDAIGFDVQCCSVPMVTAPEVRYVRADMITSPPPAAGWNEAIEAAINVVKPWPGAEGLAQSEAERAVENIRREFVKALEALRREAPAPEGEAGYVPATGPIQSGDVLRYEVDEETNVGKVTAHLRPDAGGGVRVKPLEWSGRSSNGKIHKAYVVPMEYWAWENAGFGYWSWGSLAGREVYGGLDGAKAAAQADYESRIFSALSTPPAAAESSASVEAAHLFCEKDFIGAGGQSLSWKIECDVLSDADLKTIAAVCAPSLPKFCEAVGVPRGGLRLAAAMNAYADPAAKRVLIVDDVWTTGKSMTAIGASYAEWIGFVAFARGPLPSHVSSFMSISSVSVEARLREALEKIAGSHWERVGRCQTDIDDVPDLTAQEAMQEARKALSAVGDEATKSEGGAKITHAEIIEMFGEVMPVEAVTILQSDITPNEARKRLREITPSSPTAERREIVTRRAAVIWQDLLDKDDRTSPDEYPDMALITFDELNDAILAALDGGAGA